MSKLVLMLCGIAACGGSNAPAGPDAAVAADANAANLDAMPSPMRYADVVIAAPGASGVGFGDPLAAVNGVLGGGQNNGSTDVYSLRFAPALNNSITVAWRDGYLANGPGEDFAVFENGFDTNLGPFMDLLVVEVSRDGVTWRALPHDYVTADENLYVRDRSAWRGFAGKTPVLLNDRSNQVDPFDRAAAGGDGFDLESLVGSDAATMAMRTEGVTMVRLTTAPSVVNDDTGAPFVYDSYSNGADIDGVAGRYIRTNGNR